MKFLVMIYAVLAVCSARPGYLSQGVIAPVPEALSGSVAAAVTSPIAYSSVAVPAVISEQHHAQDTLGQYRYGYSDGLTTKGEFRTLDGITQGAYAYVDGNGQIQNVAYTADSAGFRVAASNLPVAPAIPEAPELKGPEPVQDTAEVAAAKAAHDVAVGIAEARAAAIIPSVASAESASSDAASIAAPAAPSAAIAESSGTSSAVSQPSANSAVITGPSVAPAIIAAPSIVSAAIPASPAVVASPAIVAARTVISAAPDSTVVVTSVPTSKAFAYTAVATAPLTAAPIPYPGPQHIPVITAAGVPVDTLEVQAGKAADIVAHLNAKAAVLG